MTEKDNIEVALKDLILDFNLLKQDRERSVIQNKK